MGRFDATTSMDGMATIPVEVREALGLPPGGSVQFIIGDDGKVTIEAKTSDLRKLQGIFGPSTETLDIDAAIEETVRRRTAIDRTEEDP